MRLILKGLLMNRSFSCVFLSVLCTLLLPCCIKSKEQTKAKKADPVYATVVSKQDIAKTTISTDTHQPDILAKSTINPLLELPEPPKTTQTKTVRITNGITKKDIGYYKMFSWHYPSEFVLKVDGKPIEPGKSLEFQNRTITITYDYIWQAPWGKTVGAKQVTFEIPQDIDTVTINFANWDNEERISIAGAKKVSKEELIKT